MNSDFRQIILPVFTVFILCSLALAIVYRATEEEVSINARNHELRAVKKLVTIPYDNNLLDDYLLIDDAGPLSGNQPLGIYRARKNNEYVAVVFRPVISPGYSGQIKMAISISADGTVLGVDVLSHQETESLGGQIDSRQSDWLSRFNGINLNNMLPGSWATRSQGGKFDQISGATITSRSVINAVHNALEYHQKYHATLYKK